MLAEEDMKNIKICLLLPKLLIARVDRFVEEHHQEFPSRSHLLRTAIEEKVSRYEREKLDEALRAGYQALNLSRL